MVEWSILKLF